MIRIHLVDEVLNYKVDSYELKLYRLTLLFVPAHLVTNLIEVIPCDRTTIIDIE